MTAAVQPANMGHMGVYPYTHVVPRKAAAVVIVSYRNGLEVLLAQRNRSLEFMAGHHVFPGGALDDEDSPDHVDGTADDGHARYVFAAAREVFEETGLLLADGPPPPWGALREARRDLYAGTRDFAQILDDFSMRLCTSDFTPAGIWITPAFSPKRFHTQYLLYRYEGERYQEVFEPDGEIVGLEWFDPGEARRQWQLDGIRLSTPVAFVLRHLTAFPLDQALPLLQHTPGRDPDVPNRFEPRRGINIIPVRTATLPPATHTNCVVVGEEELLVVDPGAADAEEQEHLVGLGEHLVQFGGRLTGIVLTHGHGDHTSAAVRLREVFGTPIMAHAEVDAPFEIDQRLGDGEVLSVAGDPPWRLRCVYTPGHAPGHLSLFEESTRILLCGDLVANPGTIMIAPDYGGDMTQYLESLERLLELDYVLIVPSHGIPVWGSAGKELVQHLIAHRLEREGKIKAALDAGAETVQAVLERAYDDVPREAWPLAEQQLRAHLARLGMRIENDRVTWR